MPGTCELYVEEENDDKEERQVNTVADTFERGPRTAAVEQHYVVKVSAIWFSREHEDIMKRGVKDSRFI
jgi:hypothetical protein